ncbi:MAG: twin-arginine translocase TatA/TatE family subunit [Selenomonadaceae bacterium]|nr:twin-arginine translocase TatA/TatE family subunit [Selenomonadaceae bacterium]
MLGGIGVPELILILIIGLVIFGPGKLPDVGNALGKSIKEFKKATKEDKEEPVNVTPTKLEAKTAEPRKD